MTAELDALVAEGKLKRTEMMMSVEIDGSWYRKPRLVYWVEPS